jgi:hypothetical protein
LAGNAEFLLDVYRATGDRAYLDDAAALTRLLEAFATERDGLLLWPSDTANDWSPDYMIGYAGVAACLVRMSDPERHPHVLRCIGGSTPRRIRAIREASRAHVRFPGNRRLR